MPEEARAREAQPGSWQKSQSFGAPCWAWQLMQEVMLVGFSLDITSRSATGPWQVSQEIPASTWCEA